MSTLIKRLLFFGLIVAVLAACSPASASTPAPATSQVNNPYAPQPGDNALVGDTVQIVKAETTNLGSSPVQVELKISFFTPTPCHQYRVIVNPPGANGRIDLNMYSLMKKDQACALMRLATPTVASLNLGSFPAGHYTIWINGTQAAEFDA